MEHQFEIISAYSPQGDQPVAIEKLVEGINSGKKKQVLLGATGTGKTFTISNVIKEVQKPTLVMAHNKTLAGQLYSELKDFFRIMQLNILLVITIIISQKRMCRKQILLLKKMRRLMMKLINCVTQQRLHYLNGMM
ncbi:DEAD/DEAH box helicase family protein [Bacillus cereus]